MFEGIQRQELYRFLTISAGLGFQSVIFACIPFLFYRPIIECYEKPENQQNFNFFSCNEFDACNIIHKYQSDNNIFENNSLSSQYEYTDKENLTQYLIKFIIPYEKLTSLSIEYNLFCDRKIIEANILAAALGFQIFGAFLALVVKIPPYTAQKIFISMIMLSTLFAVSFNFVDNLYILAGIYCLWNMLYQFFMSIIYSQINQIFSQKIQDYAPSITNIIWVLVSIIYICGAYFIRDYRTNLGVLSSGISILASLFSIYYYDQQLDIDLKKKYLESRQQHNLEQNGQSYLQQLFKEFLQDYKIICQNKLMKNNSLSWTLCMTTICVCYTLCIVLLNTLLGNLYVNTMGHNILELIGNTLSGYLILIKIELKSSIKKMFIFIGIAYSFSFIMSLVTSTDTQEVSYFVIFQRIFPILIGKAIHEVAWTFLYTYINDLVEKEQQQLATAFGQFTSLVFCTILPYYKYLMEYLQVSSFIILPIICFFSAYCVQQYMHPINNNSNRLLLGNEEKSSFNCSKSKVQAIELQELELK